MVSPALAQQRAIINPSFESNDPNGPGAPSFIITPNGTVAGWNSTTGEIELWDTNFNGVPAYQGNVFAEMNASAPGALYQTICMVNGEQIGWQFAHRARTGGAATQTASFQIASQTGTLIQNLATQSSTINNVWNLNTGQTTYNGPSGMQRVQFTTTNPGSFGNFLDDIRINLNPFVEFSSNATTGVESIPTANLPTLIVSGSIFTSRTVTVTITGGTATRGTDYTTPGGGATFTVTIPPGIYQRTAVPLGITIINDNAIESSETITMSLVAGSGYTISGTSTCGGTPIASSTYTITDDDARLTLTKSWVNGRNGDSVDLAITGGFGASPGSSTVGGSATNASSNATVGQTITFTETFTSGNGANYDTSFACINNSNGSAITTGGSGRSRTLTVPLLSNVTCTYTNTRRSAQLTLRKTWSRARILDAAQLQSTGLANNAIIDAVANTANETDTATPVTVYAGDVATFSETFTNGNAANYSATFACTGNATAVTGTTLTVNAADTAITCTFTNTRLAVQLQLRKVWVNAITGNTVTLPATTGFTANTAAFQAVANTANETDTGTAVTVYAGDTGTIRAEVFTVGTASAYQAVLNCTGGTLSGTDARANNTLAINAADAGTTIVCSYTNARVTPLTVVKTSSVVSDGINTTNPMAIPGAIVRYCILITNPGSTTAANVIATDSLPARTTFNTGSMRSGTSCAGAVTVEDENAIGPDESDPFGMALSGTVVTGAAPNLAAGASFAMVFTVTVN
ncbi:hypothetical protein [Qipengyuania sp. JC766]|uniref:hypothetical protein n=1 Tax=Qipengyuania sp. JC766 TaxID=3232139 RepID=UPI0034576DEE